MARSSQDIDGWAKAYIQAQLDPTLLDGGHPLWWAVERFMEIIGGEELSGAEDSWATILRIVELDPPDEVTEVLAAGPLEHLIEYYGPSFIDRIESEARRNADFRDLLGGVWKSGSDEIWARIEACRDRVW